MSTLILQTAMRLIVPLGLLFSLFMALKGHNEPGGGFIGGLIAAVSLVLYRMGMGGEAFRAMIPMHPRAIVTAGMLIAVATGLAPMLLGWPFLTTWHDYMPLPGEEQVHLASALAFDAGVLLVVIGASVGMILRLSEELEG